MDALPSVPDSTWGEWVCLDHAPLWKCLVLNDQVHSMDEVVRQILKATGGSVEAAVATMLRAHHTGQAVVISGPREECERCAAVLSEIGLRTEIYR